MLGSSKVLRNVEYDVVVIAKVGACVAIDVDDVDVDAGAESNK